MARLVTPSPTPLHQLILRAQLRLLLTVLLLATPHCCLLLRRRWLPNKTRLLVLPPLLLQERVHQQWRLWCPMDWAPLECCRRPLPQQQHRRRCQQQQRQAGPVMFHCGQKSRDWEPGVPPPLLLLLPWLLLLLLLSSIRSR